MQYILIIAEAEIKNCTHKNEVSYLGRQDTSR
nr:MAG TPA: hypothetical protein [Caudoviricetes sp.]